MDILEKDVKIALANSKKGYLPPANIFELESKVKDILSIGNQTGEGWFLTAEMIEYIENDIPNIVCVQPFACLPNHVVGKGVIKTIRQKFPNANIAPVDYDPGASESNQTNRLKLLMSVAKDNLKITYQKKGLVKYDAFHQMGGQLSFCLALLDENNNGFVINSVHSTEGCYSYTKEIKQGESAIPLGTEEEEALAIALGEK